MEIKEFKKYAINLDKYSAQDVDEFEFMTDKELHEYQEMLEVDSGNLSEWDHTRAFITMKMKCGTKRYTQDDDFEEGIVEFKGKKLVEGKKTLISFKCRSKDFEIDRGKEIEEKDMYPKGCRIPRERLFSKDATINIKPIWDDKGNYMYVSSE